MKKVKQFDFPEALLKTYFGDERIMDQGKKKERVINEPTNPKRLPDTDCIICLRKSNS